MKPMHKRFTTNFKSVQHLFTQKCNKQYQESYFSAFSATKCIIRQFIVCEATL